MKQIYAGNAATKPLPFGVTTDSDVNKEIEYPPDNSDDDGEEPSNIEITVSFNETMLSRPAGKRKDIDQSKKLIESKRRHIQGQLSSSQSYNIFLEETKEDRQFQKDMLEALKQSNAFY